MQVAEEIWKHQGEAGCGERWGEAQKGAGWGRRQAGARQEEAGRGGEEAAGMALGRREGLEAEGGRGCQGLPRERRAAVGIPQEGRGWNGAAISGRDEEVWRWEGGRWSPKKWAAQEGLKGMKAKVMAMVKTLGMA